jgi:hypothetical protein
MDLVFICISLVLITAVSLYLGRVLSIKLPELSSWFDRKPFNCRPCLTFHTICCISTIVSAITICACIIYTGILMAFVCFFILKFIDNKKIIK